MNIFTRRALTAFSLMIGSSLLTLSAHAQWVSIENPATSQLLYDVAFAEGQSDIGFIGASTGTYKGKGQILRTSDNGLTWEVVWESTEDFTGVRSLAALSATEIYAGLQNGEVLKSTDGGENWAATDLSLVDAGTVTDIAFYDQNNGVAMTEWEGCFYTSDAGATWTQSSTNVVGIMEDIVYLDENTILTAGGGESIFKSEDGGDTWALVAIETGTEEPLTIYSLDFADDMHGIAVSYSGATFYTADGGTTWSNMDYPNVFAHLFFGLAVDASTYYVGGGNNAHVYMTEDAGESWNVTQLPSEVQQDAGNIVLYDMAIASNGIAIIVGTKSTILRTDTGNSVEEIEVTSLNTYPNPAQDQINLTVQVLQEGMYVFSLYNELGQELIHKQVQVAGTKNLSFNVGNFPNGSYILSISNANNKMLHQEKVQIMR